jgi:hypothetical protein
MRLALVKRQPKMELLSRSQLSLPPKVGGAELRPFTQNAMLSPVQHRLLHKKKTSTPLSPVGAIAAMATHCSNLHHHRLLYLQSLN